MRRGIIHAKTHRILFLFLIEKRLYTTQPVSISHSVVALNFEIIIIYMLFNSVEFCETSLHMVFSIIQIKLQKDYRNV